MAMLRVKLIKLTRRPGPGPLPILQALGDDLASKKPSRLRTCGLLKVPFWSLLQLTATALAKERDPKPSFEVLSWGQGALFEAFKYDSNEKVQDHEAHEDGVPFKPRRPAPTRLNRCLVGTRDEVDVSEGRAALRGVIHLRRARRARRTPPHKILSTSFLRKL